MQIYIVTGGLGNSAELLVSTVLAQFPDSQITINKFSRLRRCEELEPIVLQAAAAQAIIVQTLVSQELRTCLSALARQHQVSCIDLVGPLMEQLQDLCGQEPLGHPGLYHELHRADFLRTEAINFSISHDDGNNPQDLGQAEIILLGISRSGKTPIGMYLAVQGWKVANIPLISYEALPDELFKADRRRVFGLVIAPEQIRAYRLIRREKIETGGNYTSLEKIFNELELARAIYRRCGFSTFDLSNKPIEACADEITSRLIRIFGE